MSILPLLLTTWASMGRAPMAPNFALDYHPVPRFPSIIDSYLDSPNWVDRQFDFYYKPWMKFLPIDNIVSDKDNFKITIDVKQYKPEEVSVKVLGRYVIVQAKHEEKQGTICRQFVRKYLLPDRADADQVSSTISSDGVLTITAPLTREPKEEKERVIKIEQTGKPADSETKDEDQTAPPEKNVEENEIREELTEGQEEKEKPEK